MSARVHAGSKWVHNYFINYGRKPFGGDGSNTPLRRRGYWTHPTAKRGFGPRLGPEARPNNGPKLTGGRLTRSASFVA